MYIGEALLMISLQDTEGDEVSHQLQATHSVQEVLACEIGT